ncbi:MAG: hypothetical protein ACJAZY_000636 [Spirosomataceae bacterium]
MPKLGDEPGKEQNYAYHTHVIIDVFTVHNTLNLLDERGYNNVKVCEP